MIELCCEYLSVRYIWLYVFIMSCMHFRVNSHSIVAWMSRNSLLRIGAKLFDIQATIECGFSLKHICDMIKTYTQMHRTDKYSQHSSIIWSVWLNRWVFVYELSVCRFECRYSHLQPQISRLFWARSSLTFRQL